MLGHGDGRRIDLELDMIPSFKVIALESFGTPE
jgi:hypothetical protein